jgi:hypothetical protein
MRTRLTERDLSRIVRRVINERLEKDEVILNPVKPMLQDTLTRVEEIKNCGCGDYEQRRRLHDLFMEKLEAMSLPDKMPTLPPKEI